MYLYFTTNHQLYHYLSHVRLFISTRRGRRVTVLKSAWNRNTTTEPERMTSTKRICFIHFTDSDPPSGRILICCNSFIDNSCHTYRTIANIISSENTLITTQRVKGKQCLYRHIWLEVVKGWKGWIIFQTEITHKARIYLF